MKKILILLFLPACVSVWAQDNERCRSIEPYYYGLPVCGPYAAVLAQVDSSADFFADSISRTNTVHFHLLPGRVALPFPATSTVSFAFWQRRYINAKTHQDYDTSTKYSVLCALANTEGAQDQCDSLYLAITRALSRVFAHKREQYYLLKLFVTEFYTGKTMRTPIVSVFKGHDPIRGNWYVNVRYDRRKRYDIASPDPAVIRTRHTD